MAAVADSASVPPRVDISTLKKILYEACLAESNGEARTVFHQNSIFELDIIPNRDVLTLLQVAQKLVDEKLFKPVNDITGLGWMLRTAAEAKKYRSLTTEQEIVFAIIDEAGEEGCWTKTIKIRSNLHEAVYKAAIKFLEGKNMITDMKSVEHPARKMYIKTGAIQSDRTTGGPWFSSGVLDEAFIGVASKVLYSYIRKKTFYRASSMPSPRKPKKVINKKLSPEEAKALRAQGLDNKIKVEEQPERITMKRDAMAKWVPMPVGYQGYPSLNELTQYVESFPAIKQTLTAGEVEQLLELLVYDDKVDKIMSGEGFVYRALRKAVDEEGETILSSFTEAPCGRCPVFDLCEDGGPVGPSNCEYFDTWLQI